MDPYVSSEISHRMKNTKFKTVVSSGTWRKRRRGGSKQGLFQQVCFMLGGEYIDVIIFSLVFIYSKHLVIEKKKNIQLS